MSSEEADSDKECSQRDPEPTHHAQGFWGGGSNGGVRSGENTESILGSSAEIERESHSEHEEDDPDYRKEHYFSFFAPLSK
ncbi:hypothetical protein ACFZDP_04895 [Streptomyces mirabilis]|uniref:hypothetical protein n=1 Tax=Streptomyces mirabilis TaxID=68239 RepID=UPI0036E06D4B